MSQFSICLLFVVLAIAAIHADGDRRPCVGRCTGLSSAGKSVCIRNKATNVCTRLPACRLREKNCRRRDNGLEPIRETCITRCRNIPGTSGVGQCATRLRPRPQSDGKRIRECQRRVCLDDKLASCWRDQQGACILQTRCEAQRRNCVRNPLNQWVRASEWSCQGNVVGGGIRRCRTRPIIIKD
ncbi:uncharacterized protein LOC6524141 [Drosophila yakuba]|uniref:Uncharacterized protein n=1 Tax=Drosophila yakuba TaxID=7245 RepID=B4PZP5_DROYA|nr:uncharacterized protein LOC6524141 [Drosophila yakuba]EDX01112.1 uncharacterized protein Dyak_GE16409 [Drosophila yakuba]